MEIYRNPKNLFEQRIKDVFNDKPEKSKDLITDLLKLFCLFKITRPKQAKTWEPLNDIYNHFGMATFIEILDILGGKTIKFPTRKELKDIIISVICYYYKEIEKKSWNEIKKILSIQDNTTIQYGIKVRQLRTFLDQNITDTLFQNREKK